MKPIAVAQKRGRRGIAALADVEGLALKKKKINYFIRNKSVSADTSTVLYGHHHYQVPQYLIISKEHVMPVKRYSSPSPSSPRQPHICFPFLWICLGWKFPINGIIQCVTCAWLPPLSVRSFLTTESYLPAAVPCIVCTCSSTDGHLGRFSISATVSSAAMNIHIHVFEFLFSALLSINSGVEWLSHVVIL